MNQSKVVSLATKYLEWYAKDILDVGFMFITMKHKPKPN